ncbi:MAG: FAD-dependent oxidoreductase [Patescibacteria group bacterium]|nr:FAD-dependent oxidoreductase [Patescibacteria group bacterium]
MKLGIVGGGITGLFLAREISKKGKDEICLFEAEKELGGLSRSLREKTWRWPLEGFFHHFFTSDDLVKELLTELGLIDKLVYRETKTSVYSHGRISPFDNLFDFLRFPNLTVFDKLRMGTVLFLLRQLPYFGFFENYRASDIFPKLIGNNGWQEIWGRLMEGKFDRFSKEVSFSWLWSRIKVRSQQLGYLNGGNKQMFDLIAKQIGKNNRLFLDDPVLKIGPAGNSWLIKSKRRSALVDKIFLTLPLPKALKIVKDILPEPALKKFGKLKMIGALNLILRMKKPFLPQGTYWLNILDTGFPFIVIVEQTNLVDAGNYGGENLVYVGGYYSQEDPIFKQSAGQVLKSFSPGLKKINADFEKFLIGVNVFSDLCAQPIIPTGYSAIKPSLELIPDKIYWATPNHIFPWDRGINYSIRLSKQLFRLHQISAR